MKRRLYILIPLIILALGFFVMRGLLSFKAESPKKPVAERKKIVEARVVELENIPSQIIAYGRLSSAQPITLQSEVSGTIMKGSVLFQPAQSFRKGDLLLKIDDRKIKLDISSAKSELMNALAAVLPEFKVDFPEEYEKWQAYFDCCGFAEVLKPLPETDNQKVKLFLSRFNVYKLYFAVRSLEIMHEKHYFYAPFDGSIVSTNLRVGSTVRAGSQLGELINLENMEVELPVPAIDLQWIKQDQDVELTSTEMQGVWKGRIRRIGQSIDERTQTVPVYVGVNRPQRSGLYNGIFLKAVIPGKVISNSLSIPRPAIYDERYAYFVKEGRLEYRELEITFKEPEFLIASGGLGNGDTLVVEVLQGVAPGMLAEANIIKDGGEDAE